MSRSIVDTLLAEAPRLVVAARIEFEVPQEPSLSGDDPDVTACGQQDDPGSLEGSSHPDVVKLALVADRDFAMGIDHVVMDSTPS